MTVRKVDNVLIMTNPALIGQIQALLGETDEHNDLANLEPIDRDYPMSLEMIDFLIRHSNGNYIDTDAYRRCANIGMRKGSYGVRLIDDFGLLTDAGLEATKNAKNLDRRLKRYYERTRKTWLTPDTARSLDEIIPFGTLPGYSIRMLKYLADLEGMLSNSSKSDNSSDFLKSSVKAMKHQWRIEHVFVDDEPYILMSTVRNNMSARLATEAVYKFGLVDFVNLPKSANSGGKGRAPVGIKLTEMGKRFYSGYLSLFDPQQQFERRLAAQREVLMRDDSPVYEPYVPPANRPQPSDDLPPEEREDKYGRFDGIDLDSFAELNARLNQNLKTSDLYDPTAPITESNEETPDRTEPIQDQTDSFHNVDQPVFREVETPTRSTKKATMSDSSDIVDGENLRDLFG